MLLYHGTDLDSALDILNHGLDANKLSNLQAGRSIQVGSGWYTATDPEVAWFFASLAPGNRDHGYTVIELEMSETTVKQFIVSGHAVLADIHNVPFVAQQIWFDVTTFATLNREGLFRPCRSKERFHD